MPEPRFRVLVVDDHPIVRDGLVMLLAATRDLDPAGAVGTAADAVEAVARLRPDVVVMDLGLPDRTGFEATRELLLDAPQTRVLVLTMDHSRSTVAAALDAGARGYVLKESGGRDILAAIRSVAAGQLVFGGELVPIAAGAFAGGADARERLFPGLTAREFQVLRCLADEDGNDDIARKLGVSTKTVQNTISRLLAKLGAATRADAAAAARAAGLP